MSCRRLLNVHLPLRFTVTKDIIKVIRETTAIESCCIHGIEACGVFATDKRAFVNKS